MSASTGLSLKRFHPRSAPLAAAAFVTFLSTCAMAQPSFPEGETSPFLNDTHATAIDLIGVGNMFIITGSYITGDPYSDKDFYKFDGDAGATLVIDMTMNGVCPSGTAYQQILFLFDSSARMIAAWRNTSAAAGGPTIGIQTYTLPATDTYYIGIAEWSVAPNAASQPGISYMALATRGFSVTGTTPDATFNTAGGNQCFGAPYTVTVTVSSGNDPFAPNCAITAPAMGATASGAIAIVADITDPQMTAVTITYEYSTDAGVTFLPCTADATSSAPNPAMTPTPATAFTFVWDSITDAVGGIAPATTQIRVTANDGAYSRACTVTFDVDNVVPPPTCTVVAPPGVSSGVITFDVTLDSISSPTVDTLIEYSTDGGTSYAMTNTAPGSPLANPHLGAAIGITGYCWNSRADGVGLVATATGILLRLTVDDGAAIVTGVCLTSPFDVDNTSICGGICGDCNVNGAGPDIVDALTAAQVSAGLIVPTIVQTGCCDVNSSLAVDIIDALFIAQSSAGLPAFLVCP